MFKSYGKDTEKKDGFTLIELIIVLAIIAILSAVIYPSILKFLDSAKEKSDKLIMEQIHQAAILYSLDYNKKDRVTNEQLTVEELIKKNYLTIDLKDNKAISPVTGKEYKLDYDLNLGTFSVSNGTKSPDKPNVNQSN